jgi:hypothetical protein
MKTVSPSASGGLAVSPIRDVSLIFDKSIYIPVVSPDKKPVAGDGRG